MIKDYVLKNIQPDGQGYNPRVLLLVFCGESRDQIRGVVGHIVNERTSGETIRGTYRHHVANKSGKITYFESAVLASPTQRAPARTEAYYASGGWRATWAGEGGGVLINQGPNNHGLAAVDVWDARERPRLLPFRPIS